MQRRYADDVYNYLIPLKSYISFIVITIEECFLIYHIHDLFHIISCHFLILYALNKHLVFTITIVYFFLFSYHRTSTSIFIFFKHLFLLFVAFFFFRWRPLFRLLIFFCFFILLKFFFLLFFLFGP